MTLQLKSSPIYKKFSICILVSLVSLGYQSTSAETTFDFHWTVRHKPNPDGPRKKPGNFTISKIWVNKCLLISEHTRCINRVRPFLIRTTKIEVDLASVGGTNFMNLNGGYNQDPETTHRADIVILSGSKINKLTRTENLRGSKTLSFQDPNIPPDRYPLRPNVSISLPYGQRNDVYQKLSNHIIENCHHHEVDT
ncbi:hypothetical protein TRL7639_03075 [Falsiruegeria litorea R37]|uniref:Uncharacterized protein n=1 Tax=Falsiruegeria litorea R37 TaxID=1200284 RepID=A0A1Y5T6H0_9RHOB|nr:hypothetical protein TRL7639_03075 [Falsiruegeria litorea R37]